MRTLLLMAIVAAVAGVGVFFGLRSNPTLLGLSEVHLAPQRAEPAKAVQRSSVTALARLEPESEIVDVSAPQGSRLTAVHVKEGDFVEAGKVIAVLESHDEVVAARNHAKVLFEEAQKRYDSETAFGDATIAEVKSRTKMADELPEKAITAQECEVRRAQAELDKAQADFERARRMHKDKALTQDKFDSAKLATQVWAELLAAGKAKLEQLRKDRELNLIVLASQLKAAESAKSRNQTLTQVDSFKAALALAEERVKRTEITAPISGVALKVLMHPGEVAGQHPIVKLGDTRQMVAIAEVYETDLAFVTAGQVAIISSKAFPDTRIEGKVDRISALVHKKDVLKVDPTSDADARVIEVRIKLKDSSVAAKYNNMQVDVSIGQATS